MAEETVQTTTLELLKMKLGISTSSRNSFLQAVLKSVEKEMENDHGIILDESDHYDLMFLVDFAVYRYENTGGGMPRSLQYRLHNLIIRKKEVDSDE